MIQHIGPARLQLGAVKLKIGYAREPNALEFTFCSQHLDELLRVGARFGVSIKIHDII